MKKLYLAISLFTYVMAISQTTNIDFEAGNYTGWQLTSGINNNSLQPLTTTVVTSNGTLNSSANNCTLTTSQSLMTGITDPNCLINLNSPLGGTFVARLNNNCSGAKGSILEQTFLVNNTNSNILIAYLIVLNTSSHASYEQPYFKMDVYDQSGNVIPGNSYSTLTFSFNVTPGFTTTTSGLYYKPWTIDTINLNSYIGQNVTLKFESACCSLGGHTGYAYIDAKLNSIITNLSTLSDDEIIILPNPVSEWVIIKLKSKELIDFVIVDVLGQVVLEKKNYKDKEIDVSDLLKGTYFLKTNLNDKLITKKIIKY